jgi:hypothetical protein
MGALHALGSLPIRHRIIRRIADFASLTFQRRAAFLHVQ